MRVNIREAVQASSLKGDQNSAQGFNPGLGNSRRRALIRAPETARHVGSKSSTRLFILAPLSGRIIPLRGGRPCTLPLSSEILMRARGIGGLRKSIDTICCSGVAIGGPRTQGLKNRAMRNSAQDLRSSLASRVLECSSSWTSMSPSEPHGSCSFHGIRSSEPASLIRRGG